jgi:hypothetical protein
MTKHRTELDAIRYLSDVMLHAHHDPVPSLAALKRPRRYRFPSRLLAGLDRLLFFNRPANYWRGIVLQVGGDSTLPEMATGSRKQANP